MSVCLSVCPLAYLKKKPHVQTLGIFLCVLSGAVALSSSGDSSIRYVLPVLWMTSRFLIRRDGRSGHQVVINFLRIPQVAPQCLTLLSHTMAANCTPGAKSAVYDGLVLKSDGRCTPIRIF